MDKGYLYRILSNRLYIGEVAYVPHPAPDAVGTGYYPDILDGRQPESLTLGDLMEPLPMLWSEQRVRLGFPERE